MVYKISSCAYRCSLRCALNRDLDCFNVRQKTLKEIKETEEDKIGSVGVRADVYSSVARVGLLCCTHMEYTASRVLERGLKYRDE